MSAARKKKKKVMGANPLDALLSPSDADEPVKRPARERRSGKTSAKGSRISAARSSTPRAPDPPKKIPKVRATFHLPQQLVEDARNAVYWLSGPPTRLTLADLAAAALRSEIERLKKRYNDGQDFEQRGEDLRGGRPIGS